MLSFKAMHVFIKYNSIYHGVDKGTGILLFKGGIIIPSRNFFSRMLKIAKTGCDYRPVSEIEDVWI